MSPEQEVAEVAEEKVEAPVSFLDESGKFKEGWKDLTRK
jgi:hypothetical protein